MQLTIRPVDEIGRGSITGPLPKKISLPHNTATYRQSHNVESMAEAPHAGQRKPTEEHGLLHSLPGLRPLNNRHSVAVQVIRRTAILDALVAFPCQNSLWFQSRRVVLRRTLAR